MSNVYEYVIPQGTIQIDTALIQTDVNNEYYAAFGNDLVITPDNPQGLLITEEVLSRTAACDNNVSVANQINPNQAGGVYLDAICALTGIQRTPNTYTQVVCTLTGVTGTIIPLGSQAQDESGNIYESLAAVTLVSGTGSATFQSVVAGAITCAEATLTQIVSSVLGWETITNPAAQTVVGGAPQTDNALKTFRLNTLAAQGTALAYAIISGLYTVAGVTSVFFQENIAATTQVINGVTMVSHSIYVCISGGTNAAVAAMLTAKKSGGCSYNNGASDDPITYAYTVPVSGQVLDVLFDRPTLVPINVIVNVLATSTVSISNPVAAVQQAILDYANGVLASGTPGLQIGTPVSAFELAGAVTYENPGIFIKSLYIALNPTVPVASTTLLMAVFQQATISADNIAVNLV